MTLGGRVGISLIPPQNKGLRPAWLVTKDPVASLKIPATWRCGQDPSAKEVTPCPKEVYGVRVIPVSKDQP